MEIRGLKDRILVKFPLDLHSKFLFEGILRVIRKDFQADSETNLRVFRGDLFNVKNKKKRKSFISASLGVGVGRLARNG